MKKNIVVSIMLMVLSMAAVAQNKRIAVLETIDKEDSVAYSVKVMVRTTLAQVFSNIAGFEGVERVNLSEILDEQEFQRSGLVDEDQIKHLGESVEADYLLISEVVKYDEKSIFVTAKILNVETAQTECSENALMGTSAQNIQHGCESLANKILAGVGSFTQNKQANGQKDRIGELITFDDGTKGLVFYMEDSEHGLAVSLNEGEEAWDITLRVEDVVAVINVERGEKSFHYGEGQRNTQAILSALGNKGRAAYWCSLQGEGWYLPSSGELTTLMNVVKDDSQWAEALEAANGGEIDGWYWSSSERNDNEAWNVNHNGFSASEEKEEMVKVRAIRAF